jgi:lipopolysaccharide export system permease protein
MKILTRYLLTGLLFPLLYCLLGLSLVFIVSDLIDNFSDFLESGIRFREILYYYSQLLPSVFVEILPVCLLLAMLYSLSRLTRHSEITAMRAGGVSIGRIVLPFLGAGLAATLLTMLVHEKIAPDATWRAEMFVEYQKAGRNQERYFQDHLALKYHRRVWNIQRFDLRDGSMQNVEMVEQREDGSDAIKYNAEQARWLDGRWWFINLVVQSYRENGDLAGAGNARSKRNPADFFGRGQGPTVSLSRRNPALFADKNRPFG